MNSFTNRAKVENTSLSLWLFYGQFYRFKRLGVDGGVGWGVGLGCRVGVYVRLRSWCASLDPWGGRGVQTGPT